MLVPRITQSGCLRYEAWYERYRYFIDSIFNNLQHYLLMHTCEGNPYVADATYDWEKMHRRLSCYLYDRSSNRFRSFRLHL